MIRHRYDRDIVEIIILIQFERNNSAMNPWCVKQCNLHG